MTEASALMVVLVATASALVLCVSLPMAMLWPRESETPAEPLPGARWGDTTPEMLAAMREVDALTPSVVPFLPSPGVTRAPALNLPGMCECGGVNIHSWASQRSLCAGCGMVTIWEVRALRV